MKTQNKIMDINELCHFTDKQKEASRLVENYDYVLYGGAMGGGKSFFLRWKLVRILLTLNSKGIKKATVGLFCENYPVLKDRHLAKVREEFPDWLGDFNAADYNFVLKPRWGGGTIAFRNLDDASKYHSAEFAAIAIDELTKNTEEVFIDMRNRLRWPGVDHPKFIAATNPGGPGHLWVKKLWIDKVYPDYEAEADQFKYIQALAQDNPHIFTEAYKKKLLSMPTQKRKAYYEANWEIFEGQYFEEWNSSVHVIEPFEIPDYWLRYRSIDVSGKNGITSCHWYAVDDKGNIYAYREHYGSGLNAHEHASQIQQASREEEYQYTMIDSAAFAQTGFEESMAEIYQRQGVVGLIPSGKKQRVAGWDIIREYLKNDTNHPRLRVFNRCKNLIRTIPSLVHDPMNSDDIDTGGEDHAADELRYFLQSLRDQRAPDQNNPPKLNIVQRRLQELYGHKDDFDYSYTR